MGNISTPCVREVIVGPLPNPTYIKSAPGKPREIPFEFRPIGLLELSMAEEFLVEIINSQLGDMIMFVYNASLVDCEEGDNCVWFPYFSQMSAFRTSRTIQ